MGTKANRSLQARRRREAAAVERLLEGQNTADREAVIRRGRVQRAVQVGRRHRRALELARGTVVVAEAAIGVALWELVDEGLSRSEAFRLLGLSRHQGRRYLKLAVAGEGERPPGRSSASLSTRSAAGCVVVAPVLDGGSTPPLAPTDRRFPCC